MVKAFEKQIKTIEDHKKKKKKKKNNNKQIEAIQYQGETKTIRKYDFSDKDLNAHWPQSKKKYLIDL